MVKAACSGSQVLLRPVFTSNISIALVTALEERRAFLGKLTHDSFDAQNLKQKRKLHWRSERILQWFGNHIPPGRDWGCILPAGTARAAATAAPWESVQWEPLCWASLGESTMGGTQGCGAKDPSPSTACFTTPASHCTSLWAAQGRKGSQSGGCPVSRHACTEFLF